MNRREEDRRSCVVRGRKRAKRGAAPTQRLCCQIPADAQVTRKNNVRRRRKKRKVWKESLIEFSSVSFFKVKV